MLEIEQLHASVEGTKILKGIDLRVNAGEVHAIMGPNGSGKSTLANVIAGRPGYEVTGGKINYEGQDLVDTTPDDRALSGIFLAMQYPVELPGVRNRQFIKAALDALRNRRGQEELTAREFDTLYRAKVVDIGMDPDLSRRNVNEGFSGGEKKRNEMLQLAILEPKLALLDETDSGLDIDALRTIATGINGMRSSDRAFILVTHYQRILSYINPDYVHVLVDGQIGRQGGSELSEELEAKGYKGLIEPANRGNS